MEYETVIGLEVHVQLQTQSKMFCSCRADYQSAPVNSRVCPVCLGLPGALPVINRKAVEYTIMTGLALNCDIPRTTKFDRKNYPYPDLMKGYQISQYDLPIAVGGQLQIEAEGSTKAIGVTRVHLEEDVAKMAHFPGDDGGYSLVDVNRSGVPLMEIVSEPDIRSAEEARTYLTTLHSLLQYLGVTTGNMQDGSFRCDANISIRPAGSEEFGNRTEIKNVNSFRSVYMALNYEVQRQQRVLEDGGRVVQETRGWLEDRGVTVSQRSKEDAHDYRYFPEPDLPPLDIEPSWVQELQAALPELAPRRCSRFQWEYGLSEYDAGLLTTSKGMADYFETAASLPNLRGQALESHAKQVGNWMLGDLSGLLNSENRDISECPVSAESLVELIGLVNEGTISVTMAKTVLEEAYSSGASPKAIVAERGYTQISDTSSVEPAVREALDANPRAVDDYLSGKDSAAKFLVGQVMKITRGQAKPDLVNQLVTEALERAKAHAG